MSNKDDKHEDKLLEVDSLDGSDNEGLDNDNNRNEGMEDAHMAATENTYLGPLQEHISKTTKQMPAGTYTYLLLKKGSNHYTYYNNFGKQIFMDFKEWLNEARLKGFKRIFQQQFPNLPHGVSKDLYDSRVGHTMNTLTRSSSGDSSGYRTPESEIPSNSATQILSRLGDKFGNLSWGKPEILLGKSGTGVTPLDFDPETVEYFVKRSFGFTEIMKIPNDMRRTQVQKMLMQQRPTNQPVIIIQTLKGFKLIEGWHRTMSYLLKGATPQMINLLQNGQQVDLKQWQPVQIMAYVGRGPEIKMALAGTGDWTLTPININHRT